MTTRLPLFAINAVLFPGVTTQLHVFEDRYRALVEDLLAIEDPAARVFGTTAIREGYEVGEHGVQSLHTVGTTVQLVDVDPYEDGRYDIDLVARERFLTSSIDASGSYPVGLVEPYPDIANPSQEEDDREAVAARATFDHYRDRVSDLLGTEVLDGDLPRDPTWLSWSLAELCPLDLQQQQELLSMTSVVDRLHSLRRLMRTEMAAMRVVPSQPATQIARMRWSPN